MNILIFSPSEPSVQSFFPFELLLFLAKNPKQVFTSEHLYERVWGLDSYGDLDTVTVTINRLRQKIEENPATPKHILTVWGVGYKFEN